MRSLKNKVQSTGIIEARMIYKVGTYEEAQKTVLVWIYFNYTSLLYAFNFYSLPFLTLFLHNTAKFERASHNGYVYTHVNLLLMLNM